MGVIWLVPVIGAVLYALLGINRIKRRARALRSSHSKYHISSAGHDDVLLTDEKHFPYDRHFIPLAHLADGIIQKPLTCGNYITPLVNGDTAYPAMIKAINEAEHSINLSTYIFDNDKAGRMFHEALAHAADRRVKIRIIIDDMGARYSWPPIINKLRKAGIRVVRFLPTLLPWRMPFMNLRNHRKILVIDGKTGFTGGMNIRQGLILEDHPRHPLKDLHFYLEGPVVAHLQEAFAEDWAFCTGELLDSRPWVPLPAPEGPALARGIPDGPDEDFEKLQWIVHGALACATSSVRIVTPYFLPDASLIRALNIASMRGVKVDIILPSVNNLPMIKWASTDLWGQLIKHGCRIWLTPPPFDHSKLMIVDGVWILFGSANWDPRSFRLNFEFNIECYDRALASEMDTIVDSKLNEAYQVTLEDVNNRKLPVKLRDGIARLFSPYM